MLKRFYPKRLCRIKTRAKKFAKRLRFWKNLLGDNFGSEARVTRLFWSGNLFRTSAKYRGDRMYRFDCDCFWKTPYHYTKSEWRAKELDREIRLASFDSILSG